MKIPERARGYRNGMGDLVTAMHWYARTLDYCGSQASMDAFAHRVGIAGKERFRDLIALDPPCKAEQPRPRKELTFVHCVPIREGRSFEATKRMFDPDENGPSIRFEPEPYRFGYLEALKDGCRACRQRCKELHDPPAREAMADLLEAVAGHFIRMLARDSVGRSRWR